MTAKAELASLVSWKITIGLQTFQSSTVEFFFFANQLYTENNKFGS